MSVPSRRRVGGNGNAIRMTKRGGWVVQGFVRLAVVIKVRLLKGFEM